MLPEEHKLQVFISAYYLFSITCGLTTNILLLFIMKTTKSALLRDMQYYLLNTTVLEILLCVSTFFVQCRVVPNVETLAVFCHGPCKYFGPNCCFFGFAFLQAIIVAASFSILLSFYLRYKLLQVDINLTRNDHVKIFAFFSILPIANFIFDFFTDTDIVAVEKETRKLHPDYDYEFNSLVGFSNTKSIGSIVAQLIISVGVYVSPFIALYYRRQINNTLSRTTGRKIPIAQMKQLVNGLLLQTLVPFFVYIPPLSYFLYSQHTGHSFIHLEYLLNIFGSFTAFINPILTFCYVLPYRRALFKKVFRAPNAFEEVTKVNPRSQNVSPR